MIWDDHVVNTKETSGVIGMRAGSPILVLRALDVKSSASCWYEFVPSKSNLADKRRLGL